MTKTICVCFPSWLLQKIDRECGKNRSARVQELVIKGIMQEHDENIKAQIEQAKKEMEVSE